MDVFDGILYDVSFYDNEVDMFYTYDECTYSDVISIIGCSCSCSGGDYAIIGYSKYKEEN